MEHDWGELKPAAYAIGVALDRACLPTTLFRRCGICCRMWDSEVCPIDGGTVSFDAELTAFNEAGKLERAGRQSPAQSTEE